MKLYIFLLFIGITVSIFAEKKSDNLIIFKVIADENITKSNIDIINTSVETNLTSLGYGIINEKIQNEALEEQKKQQNSDCYDDQCLVDTGRMLTAKKLLIIRITKQESGNFFIKLRKIDIESGIIENSFASTSKLKLDNYEELDQTIKKLLKKIFKESVKIGKTLVKEPSATEKSLLVTTKVFKILSNIKGVEVFSDKSLGSRYRLGRTPLNLRVENGAPRTIYLLKYGYIVKEYTVKYNHPNQIKLILDEAPKYKLTINTDLNYKISYTPLLNNQANIYNAYNKNYSRGYDYNYNFSKKKYFKRDSKIIYLPQGRYSLVLTKKGYTTIYKTISLNKDETIEIQDKKEILSFGGIEILTEFKVFLGVDSVKNTHFHAGTIISLLTFITKGMKIDFMRFGFLSDFKQEDSLNNIKFSFLNLEFYPSKNIYMSFLLGFMLSDGDILFDVGEENSTFLLAPLGIKVGYRLNLIEDKFNLKFYSKADWLIVAGDSSYDDTVSTSESEFGLSLTFGMTLDYLF